MEDRWIDQSEERKRKDMNRVFGKGVLLGTLTTLLFAITLVMVLLVGNTMPAGFPSGFSMQHGEDSTRIRDLDPMEKLQEIEQILRNDFLFMDEVSDEELLDGIFSGFVGALGDPYTVYFNQELTRQLTEHRQGSFYGIGASLRQIPDRNGAEIVRTFDDSPAQRAGLMSGDIIVQVDDKVITDQDIQEIVSWIRGEEGTIVELTVDRDGEELFFVVERANIQIQSVRHEMLEGNIGFITIEEFGVHTASQFQQAMIALDEEGMVGLIVDLRYNPGGMLNPVVEILRNILPEGVIVSMEDVHGNVTVERTDGRNAFDRPMVVLVNGFSASASEIFAGAVQDHEMATVVGTSTFGKALVQRPFNLSDGSSMHVTIAEYFTPNRQRISENGIIPDVEVEFDYTQEVEHEDDLIDAQLDTAIEIMRGKLQ